MVEEEPTTTPGTAFRYSDINFILLGEIVHRVSGKPLNELKQVAESSLTAIMARNSAYTGKTISWEDALNDPTSLMPAKIEWGPMPTPPVPMPGQVGTA